VADPVRPRAAEFCDLVDALAGLHAVGWCHRDPRPANFFRDATGRFFLADLGSAVRIGDAAAAADGRKWAPQYGPLAALRAAATGAPPPAPAPAHDFEQVARLVFACAGGADALPRADDAATLTAWWEQRDALLLLEALLRAAAAAAQGDAARRAFQDVIRKVLL
jgi:serine/threonine protein kinase